MNEFCRRFGISTPILNAGMGLGIAGPKLAAAVASAGGLGVLGLGGFPPALTSDAIREMRKLHAGAFGANQLLPLLQDGAMEVCFEERVPLLVLFWGDPSPYVADARSAGVALFSQVGSAEEASLAADAGVEGIVIQGKEAGGHVKATEPIERTLRETVAAVSPLPVIAAGGIRSGADIAWALGEGASAVSVGSRYVTTPEARVVPEYKQRLIESGAADTVLTELYGAGWPNAPHRVLKNAAYRAWEAEGRPEVGRRTGEGEIIGRVEVAGQSFELPRFTVNPPVLGVAADIEDLPLYAGESCEAITEIVDAATVTRRFDDELKAALGG